MEGKAISKIKQRVPPLITVPVSSFNICALYALYSWPSGCPLNLIVSNMHNGSQGKRSVRVPCVILPSTSDSFLSHGLVAVNFWTGMCFCLNAKRSRMKDSSIIHYNKCWDEPFVPVITQSASLSIHQALPDSCVFREVWSSLQKNMSQKESEMPHCEPK